VLRTALPTRPRAKCAHRAPSGSCSRGAGSTSSGKINLINGGSVEFSQGLTNTSTGRIAGRGTLIVSGGLINNGQIAMSSGFSDILGSVTNNSGSGVLITGGGTTTFYDPVQHNAGADIDVAVNSAVVFLSAINGLGSFSGSGTKYFADGSSSLASLETTGSSVVEAPADLTVARFREESLTVKGAALVLADGTAAGASYLTTLSIGGSGVLDLTDNDLVVNEGDFSTIFDLVMAGLSSAVGITSSSSDGNQILALFDNALVGSSDWLGVPIADNAVVGKYTYFGDMNIDGQVTGDDYTVVDANLNTDPAVGLEWVRGDANLDGIVTGDDYTVIDAKLGLGVGNPLSTGGRLSALPEPTGVGLAALVVVGLGARRHRRTD
jgi:hypothetical protein